MVAHPMVVVAGATGYLGKHVVRALHAAGYRVRALARDAGRLEEVRACVDQVVIAEATRPETLAGLCDDAHAVFSSLGIRHFHRRPTIWDVDERANVNVAREAERAGVGRFVFVSVLHGSFLRERLAVAEARERVVDYLESTSMRCTVLRPTGFFNDMDEIFAMAQRGRVWLVGDGETRINPIHGADIAAEVVAAIAAEEPPSSVPLGGPDLLSMNEIAELAFAALGKPPRVSHLPASLLRGAAALTRPFNENAAAFLHMFSLVDEGFEPPPLQGSHHLDAHFQNLSATV